MRFNLRLVLLAAVSLAACAHQAAVTPAASTAAAEADGPAPEGSPGAAALPEACPSGLAVTAARTALRARGLEGETLSLDVESGCAVRAVELLRRRLHALGAVVQEASVEAEGARIVAVLPDEVRERLSDVLAVRAVTLHEVDEKAAGDLMSPLPAELTDRGVSLIGFGDQAELVARDRAALADLDEVLPLKNGGRWMVAELRDADPSQTRYHALPVLAAGVRPEHFARCGSEAEVTDWGYQVTVRLTAEGAEAMSALTTRIVGRRLAIVVDGEVMSAPVVMEPIRRAFTVLVEDEVDAQVLEAAVRESPLPCGVRLRAR